MALTTAAPLSSGRPKVGFRYRLSVLQAEFSLTQIWDHPRHGREFFEQVIRENIDLGRPETVQSLFAVLLLLCLQLEGFRNRQLRPLLAQMLGLEESNMSAGRVSYELRRRASARAHRAHQRHSSIPL